MSSSQDVVRENFRFQIDTGLQLFGRIWQRRENAKATVIGVHGYSEHSNCYEHFARFLNSKDYHYAGFDLPGHGLSEGRPNDILDFNMYLESLQKFLDELDNKFLAPPLILFGHSLGGLICIRFLQTHHHKGRFERCLLSSPLLGLSPEVFFGLGKHLETPVGNKVFKMFTSALPNWSIPSKNELAGSVLTHDQKKSEERANDPLVNSSVTLRWTQQFLVARQRAFEEVHQIKLPLAIFQAGDDRVVSAPKSKEFYDLLTTKERLYKLYPGLFHEILNEHQRAEVMRDMLQWIEGDESSGSVVSI